MATPVHRKSANYFRSFLWGLVGIAASVCIFAGVVYAGGVSPEEFERQYAEGRCAVIRERLAGTESYTVKSFHSYYISVKELGSHPNRVEGSKQWIVKRIVNPQPDAFIIFLRRPMGPMYYNAPVVCVALNGKVPGVVWQSDEIGESVIQMLLRNEGLCLV